MFFFNYTLPQFTSMLNKRQLALMKTEDTEILIETEKLLFTPVSISLPQCLINWNSGLMRTEKEFRLHQFKSMLIILKSSQCLKRRFDGYR